MKRLIFIFMVLGHSVFGTLLVNENFESGTVPTGWVNSAANFNYTASPLAGSVSLRLPHNAQAYYDLGGALNNTEVWFNFLFKAETITTNNLDIINLAGTGYVFTIEVSLLSDGTLLLQGGGTDAQTVSAMSAGTIYNIWGHYKKGTGANAISELSFDIVGNSRPNSGTKYVTVTNGAATLNAGSFYLDLALGGSDAVVVDNVQISDTDIFGGVTASPSPSNRFFLFPKP